MKFPPTLCQTSQRLFVKLPIHDRGNAWNRGWKVIMWSSNQQHFYNGFYNILIAPAELHAPRNKPFHSSWGHITARQIPASFKFSLKPTDAIICNCRHLDCECRKVVLTTSTCVILYIVCNHDIYTHASDWCQGVCVSKDILLDSGLYFGNKSIRIVQLLNETSQRYTDNILTAGYCYSLFNVTINNVNGKCSSSFVQIKR